jgi:hypothetical protein
MSISDGFFMFFHILFYVFLGLANCSRPTTKMTWPCHVLSQPLPGPPALQPWLKQRSRTTLVPRSRTTTMTGTVQRPPKPKHSGRAQVPILTLECAALPEAARRWGQVPLAVVTSTWALFSFSPILIDPIKRKSSVTRLHEDQAADAAGPPAHLTR